MEEPQSFFVQDLNPVPFQNTGDEVMNLTLRTDSSMVAKANSLLEWSYTAHMVLWIGFRVAVNAPSRFASCDDLFSPFMVSEGSRERNGPFCLFLFILTVDPLKLLEDFAITYF